MLVFEERGKQEYPEKTSRCRVENQQTLTLPVRQALDELRHKDTIVKRQNAWVEGHKLTYNSYRNKVQKMCSQARQLFYKSMTNKNHDHAKWWKSIKSLAGLSNPPILLSFPLNGDVIKDEKLTDQKLRRTSRHSISLQSIVSPLSLLISTSSPLSMLNRLFRALTLRNLSILTIYQTGH